MELVVGQEDRAQRGADAEGGGAGRERVKEVGGDQTGVVLVDHNHPGGGLSDLVEEGGGVVDLPEAVELVAHDVEQERGLGAYVLDEAHRVGLVELEDGDISVHAPAPVDLGEQGGEHATDEVGAGPVGQDLQTLRL